MKTIKQTVALIVLMSSVSAMNYVLAGGQQLQGMTAQAAGQNKTQVRLTFNSPVNIPKGFVLEDPPRLVFDFPGTEISPDSRQKTVNLGKIESIEAADNKGKARVMIRMKELVNYTIGVEGNTVVMAFDSDCGVVCKPSASAPIRSGAAKSDVLPDKFTQEAAATKAKPVAEAKPPVFIIPPSAKTQPAPKPVVEDKAKPVIKPAPEPASQQAKPVVPELPELPPPAPAKPLDPSFAWYAPPAPVPAIAKPAPEYVPPAAPANRISTLQNVDFRREPDGGGKLVITLPSAATEVESDQRGNALTLSLRDVDAPAHLQQRMDVMDFGTPVSAVDVSQQGMNTRIRVSAHEGFEHRVTRNGNEYTVYIDKNRQSPEEKLAAEKKPKTFSGEKLSLNFQDIEVRAVLQLLADFTDKNIVVSDTVQGNITVRLKDVPWDQALDIVLESKNLAMRENGNVIWVAPATELAAKEKQELEALMSKQQLEPLVTEYIPVNFAKAVDLAALIEKSKGNGKQSLLSPRGKVSVDERTNTLLVQETVSQVKSIRDLVKVLDVPIEQVLIESRIVTATDGFSKELGAKFGVSPKWHNSSSTGIATGNLGSGTEEYFTSIAEANAAAAAAAATPDTADDAKAAGMTYTLPGLTDRLSVNLPVTGAAGSFGFSVLTRDFLIDLELSALQAENKGEIISTPRVITSNQTKALIEQGVEIPYLQASSSGATNVAFKKAVLSLEVTPQITPDEHISMDLKVNQDTVGQIFSGVPSINTREVQTKVLVENGQTIVLGGVHEESNVTGTTKVPVLGDVPVLGKLFRTDTKSNDKRELLIFVTPKIVDGKS
ncbi:MAG: type IV pilus secretin PilQ [Gammaproteobacteria bacterium]|nr:type IV pilus secretin PilQ [Gammaproteobacteria bacterium]MBU1724461.1 type IV pilus secretin PilQ [Gammaproteobacteria bacterium]MBU2004183.1 type IV pilus secretin PilQ [Gammaproteobacteria bacterium]